MCGVLLFHTRATGKTRLHAQHGNRVFGQLPCFLLFAVKMPCFLRFAVKSAVFCNFGYLFYYLVTAVLALLTTFQPVVKEIPVTSPCTLATPLA